MGSHEGPVELHYYMYDNIAKQGVRECIRKIATSLHPLYIAHRPGLKIWKWNILDTELLVAKLQHSVRISVLGIPP